MKQAFYDWFVVSTPKPHQNLKYLIPRQYYKVFRGSGLNTIVGGKFQNSADMMGHIAESHSYWLDLIHGKTEVTKISTWQTSRPSLCKNYVASEDATKEFDIPPESDVEAPAERPSKYDHWYYLDENFDILPGQVIDVI